MVIPRVSMTTAVLLPAVLDVAESSVGRSSSHSSESWMNAVAPSPISYEFCLKNIFRILSFCIFEATQLTGFRLRDRFTAWGRFMGTQQR